MSGISRKPFSLVLALVFLMSSLAISIKPLEAGRVAPEFRLTDLNQKTFLLSSVLGKKPVVLFFWTTWCPFCRVELRSLSRRYARLTQEGIELLFIDVGESEAKVNNFLRTNSISINVFMDKDTKVASLYSVLGVPTYVFIDKKGNIVSQKNSFPENEYRRLLKLDEK